MVQKLEQARVCSVQATATSPTNTFNILRYCQNNKTNIAINICAILFMK